MPSRHIPVKLQEEVRRRDGNRCQNCARKVPPDLLDFDHIRPRSRGGETTADNLQLLCRTRNSSKGNRGEFCKCGQFIPTRAKFCQGCGAKNIPANHRTGGKVSEAKSGANFDFDDLFEILRKIALAIAIILILVGLGFIRC